MPSFLPMALHDGPCCRSRTTSSRRMTLLGRPTTFPAACAALIPESVRSRIISRSNSAYCGEPQYAQFEREILRERTKAGLAHARENGQRLGRPATAAIHAV